MYGCKLRSSFAPSPLILSSEHLGGLKRKETKKNRTKTKTKQTEGETKTITNKKKKKKNQNENENNENETNETKRKYKATFWFGKGSFCRSHDWRQQKWRLRQSLGASCFGGAYLWVWLW